MTPTERGASWLDANRPDWLSIVDPSTLDMSTSDRCMWGQLDGQFGFIEAMLKGDDGWMVAHGFYIDCGNEQDYEHLTEQWKALIRDRRLAGQQLASR